MTERSAYLHEEFQYTFSLEPGFGAAVGFGVFVGFAVGFGVFVGFAVGFGVSVGFGVGAGVFVGAGVGAGVGSAVGASVGTGVSAGGTSVGTGVGASDAGSEGAAVAGISAASSVGLTKTSGSLCVPMHETLPRRNMIANKNVSRFIVSFLFYSYQHYTMQIDKCKKSGDMFFQISKYIPKPPLTADKLVI